MTQQSDGPLQRPLLLVRAEAGTVIGTGHVLRMLALAQAWQDRGGRAHFLFAQENEGMRRRLEGEHCAVTVLQVRHASVEDAGAVAALARQKKPAWLAVDGYDFGEAYLQRIAAGTPVLCCADYVHAGHFPVSLLLNPNPHARADDYAHHAPRARLLLGLNYLLLRREFHASHANRPARSGVVNRVLITLGGADQANITTKLVRALAGKISSAIRVQVIIGANNPHGDEVRIAVSEAGPSFTSLENVADMPALLREIDLAICASGTTCWEMACLGIPALTIVLAENQAPLAADFARLECGINLGWHDQLDYASIPAQIAALASHPRMLAAMAARGPQLIDGRGAERVVATMRPDTRAVVAGSQHTSVQS